MQREDVTQSAEIGTEDLVRPGSTVHSEHDNAEQNVPTRDDAGHPDPDPAHPDPDEPAALIEDADGARFRDRWHAVQEGFVDDPRRAVQDADRLVAELMQTLAATFAERKRSLENQWRTGGDAQTEDLRLALRGYRSFFDQLLPH